MCEPQEYMYPYDESVVSSDAEIWLLSPSAVFSAGEPYVERGDGQVVRMVSSPPREVKHEWWGGHRVLRRFRAAAPLEPGVYQYSFNEPLSERYDAPSEADPWSWRGTRFRVIAGVEAAPPPLPELVQFRFRTTPADAATRQAALHGASFLLRVPSGILVADFASPNEDPLESVHLSRPSEGLQWFSFGQVGCGAYFQAHPCMRTSVRFGALSAAGRFSGWAPSLPVEFPGENCPTEAPAAQPPAQQHARTRWLWVALSAVVVSAILAATLARRSRHSS